MPGDIPMAVRLICQTQKSNINFALNWPERSEYSEDSTASFWPVFHLSLLMVRLRGIVTLIHVFIHTEIYSIMVGLLVLHVCTIGILKRT